jgi:hypothetical protein
MLIKFMLLIVVATSNRDDDDYATDAPSSLQPQVVAGNYDDFLTFYSTVPGFVSFRNKLTGRPLSSSPIWNFFFFFFFFFQYSLVA